MVFNIKTSYGGITQAPNQDMTILVSRMPLAKVLGLDFVSTNLHAYRVEAEIFSELSDLGPIDWPVLQSRDFRHNPDDPDYGPKIMLRKETIGRLKPAPPFSEGM